ncbi:MAG: hypothetical protein ACRD6B_15895 [Bryobacteraceae bacterium]
MPMPSTDDNTHELYPQAWRPNTGDVITGVVVERSVVEGTYGPYPCIVLATANGDQAVHAFHSVLRSECDRMHDGDNISITYQGVRNIKNPKPGRGTTYHHYDVALHAEGFGRPEVADVAASF